MNENGDARDEPAIIDIHAWFNQSRVYLFLFFNDATPAFVVQPPLLRLLFSTLSRYPWSLQYKTL